MRSIVTGSAGFIGSHLLSNLDGELYPIDLKHGKDLLQGALDTNLKVDVVFHLAAMPLVPMGIEKPLYTFQHNVLATLNVLEYCRKSGAKLIFTSSAQATPNALNPYALQKYQCEQWIKIYSKLYGVETIVLKLHNVFGDGGHTVIETFLNCKAKKQPLTINGGEQQRDFIHVDTVVQALSRAVGQEAGVYEVGTGVSTSIQYIADLISPNQERRSYPVNEPLKLSSSARYKSMSIKEYLNA